MQPISNHQSASSPFRALPTKFPEYPILLWRRKRKQAEKAPTVIVKTNATLLTATRSSGQMISIPNSNNVSQASNGVVVTNLQTPQAKNKVTLLKEILQANDANIAFYGRLEDQFGSAVSSANIDFSIQYENPNDRGIKRGQVMSDNNGGFTISGYKGAILVSLCQTTNRFSTINQLAKAGRMIRSATCNPAMMRLSPRAVG